MSLPVSSVRLPTAAVPNRSTSSGQRRHARLVVRAEQDGPDSTLRLDLCRAPATESVESDPNVCKACGMKLSDAPRGCDREGRVAGGVGAFISWWPIKAYRECPALAASGKRYVRKGQITDEVLFGRKGEQTKF